MSGDGERQDRVEELEGLAEALSRLRSLDLDPVE